MLWKQSLAARQTERLVMSHKSYEDAKLWHEEKLRTVTTKKSPVGKFENMDWEIRKH